MNPHDVRRDFVLQMLLQAVRLTNSGKPMAVREMGFRQDQIEKLVLMPVEHLVELASCATKSFVAFSVDPEALDAAFIVLDRRRKEVALSNELIRAGASYTVMHELFAFDTVDYAEARKRLGLSAYPGGRPARPAPEVQGKIWGLWHSSNETVPERLLSIYRETGVEIRSIWPLILAWDAGEPPPELDPADLLN